MVVLQYVEGAFPGLSKSISELRKTRVLYHTHTLSLSLSPTIMEVDGMVHLRMTMKSSKNRCLFLFNSSELDVKTSDPAGEGGSADGSFGGPDSIEKADLASA